MSIMSFWPPSPRTKTMLDFNSGSPFWAVFFPGEHDDWLVVDLPLLKNMTSSVGMMKFHEISNIWKVIKAMFQTNQMINHEMWSKLGGLTAWVDHFLTHHWAILDPRCCETLRVPVGWYRDDFWRWDVWFGWSWAHHPMHQGDTDMKINRPTSTITIQLENLSNFLGLGSSVVFTDRFTKLMLPHLAICGKVSGVYQSPSGWRGYPRIRDHHESLRIVYLRI